MTIILSNILAKNLMTCYQINNFKTDRNVFESCRLESGSQVFHDH